jgi:hypothetical protein
MPSRREFLQFGAALTMQEASSPGLEEVSLVQLQEGLAISRWTSVFLVEAYLARIDRLDRQCWRIDALIELNPDARPIAAELDRERKERGAGGPLHGIPVVVKDNIETGDRMMTSAGSVALADAPAREDAELVTRLRTAGAVILGKTNLSEWVISDPAIRRADGAGAAADSQSVCARSQPFGIQLRIGSGRGSESMRGSGRHGD